MAVCCRVMGVSTSGFYAWQANPVSNRDWADAVLTDTIFDIHWMSRRSYGSPRVHAELVLGEGERCSRKRVERLMARPGSWASTGAKAAAAPGGPRRRTGRGSGQPPLRPGRAGSLSVMDVTEHPSEEGKVYLAVVHDAWSRRVVGWSIADHIRAELVVDAVQMAIWRRRPPPGQTIAHSDHGSQYTSWAFGRRLRAAGLLGSMGSIGDASTIPSPRVSSAPSSSNSSTSTIGPVVANWPRPSSNGWSVGTTPRGDTATARCSVRSTTKPASYPPHLRHDHHNQPVRWTGGSSQRCCIVTLGWPKGRYGRKARKPVGTVVHI